MASKCATCPMREKAEKNPQAIMSKIWKWHTTWCPGWKAYQRALAAKQAESNDKENHDHASCHP